MHFPRILLPAGLKKYSPLVRELVGRDLKLKYRRSLLGYVWSLLNPLLTMIVMTLVFSYMFRFDIPNYPLYLICGQTLFGFFNEATNRAMTAILDNGMLIKKVYIPKYIFPVAKVASCFATMSFSLVAILIVMLFTGARLYWSALLFWVPLAFLFLFACGVGMALSALAVQFRDILHLYGVLTMLWMYLTPIFYPIEQVPAAVASLIRLNPMYIYIDLFRNLLLYGTVPALSAWAAAALSALGMFAIGAWIFRKMQHNFIFYV